MISQHPDDLLLDGPPDSQQILVLAHGAGAPMDSPFMNAMSSRLARSGIHVVRFEFDYMKARRKGERRPPDREPQLRKRWLNVIGRLAPASRLVIGGKSLGGRIASLIADEAGVRGLVCLGYPFHPPANPEKLRTAHLAGLRTPGLIIQGTRDAFGRPEEVAGYALSANLRLVWIEDGDHSLEPRKSSGRTAEQNLDEAAEHVTEFLRSAG